MTDAKANQQPTVPKGVPSDHELAYAASSFDSAFNQMRALDMFKQVRDRTRAAMEIQIGARDLVIKSARIGEEESEKRISELEAELTSVREKFSKDLYSGVYVVEERKKERAKTLTEAADAYDKIGFITASNYQLWLRRAAEEAKHADTY
jgi:hypothetical protein